MKRWAIGVVALAFLVLIGVAMRRDIPDRAKSRGRSVPTVTVVRPERREMARRINLTGDVLGIQQTELMAKVPGFIDKIYVDRGDFVKRGQILALLTYPEQEAAYAKARAALDLAEANYSRAKDLFKRGVNSRQDLDNAVANYKSAKEQRDAEETLYNYREIRAPFSGYIIRRNYDTGHLVTPSGSSPTPLFVLADISAVRVFVYVPEEDLGALRTGTYVTVSSDAYPEKTFRGEVTRIAQGLDSATRTMQSEIDIANPEGELKPGMFVRVGLVLYRHPNALTLPPATILHGEQGSYVYTVETSRARHVPIKTGLQDGEAVEIVGGLDAGAMVIATGTELIEDNTTVNVALASPQPGTAIADHR